MKKTLRQMFEGARRVGVPIVKVRSADQNAVIDDLRTDDFNKGVPMVRWDAADGLAGVNDAGDKALAKLDLGGSSNFVTGMTLAYELPKTSIIFALNAHRQLQSQEPGDIAASVQVVANARNKFKTSHRTLVLLGPDVLLPIELESDVVALEHELPSDEELAKIIAELLESAYAVDNPKLAKLKPEAMAKAVDAVRGLSAFAAEQVVSMSMDANGLDLGALWERKRVAIEQTPGLRVWRGGERFTDLVGLGAVKTKLTRRTNARQPIGCVVFIDEIDKAMANVEQDTSGVRMDQLMTLLTEMENHEAKGMIAVGVPGAGKSMIAKALGNEAGVPTAQLDLGGMESKYVGESEARIRHAMNVIKAIGGGHFYVIATSNNATVMRPELQRRFTDGVWFFDLMTPEERKAAWAFYIKKYELTPAQTKVMPDDDAWTGAEIRNCARDAWDLKITLVEAAKTVIPMARTRSASIEQLRMDAAGKFLDASNDGPYQYTKTAMEKQLKAVEQSARQFSFATTGGIKKGES